jgi:iron complex transport system ATP-binding protein
MKIIELSNVTFRRNERRILDGVSWIIEQGQHWELLGANGSGKTTLLKILTGYEWPTEGGVVVLSSRYGACDLRAHRKAIGWVSAALEHRIPREDTALEVVASGFEASLGVYRLFTADETERANHALTQVGGRALASQPFSTLSQGEQQRTLIARALVNQPTLLVLDEPCAGLDPAARLAFLEVLQTLSESPKAPTLLLVSHHIEEIGPWITHVHALKEGITLAQGPVAEVLTTDVMTEALSCPCEVLQENGRYRLAMPHRP